MATTEDGAGDRGMSERLDVAYRAYFEFRGGARKSMAAALAAVDAYDREHAAERVTDEMVQRAIFAVSSDGSPYCDREKWWRHALVAALSCAPVAEPTEAPAPDPNEEYVIWSGQFKRWWLRGEGGYVSGCTDDLAKASCWSRRTAEAMVRGCWPEEHVEIRPAPPRVPKPDLSALLADVAKASEAAGNGRGYESDAWAKLAAWARAASGERT